MGKPEPQDKQEEIRRRRRSRDSIALLLWLMTVALVVANATPCVAIPARRLGYEEWAAQLLSYSFIGFHALAWFVIYFGSLVWPDIFWRKGLPRVLSASLIAAYVATIILLS